MKTILKISAFSILLFIAVESCKPKKVSAETAAPATAVKTKFPCSTANGYQMAVKGIIDKNCALSCHSAEKSAGGINLSTYEDLKSEAGKPRFIGALKHQAEYAPMPKKNPKLSDSTINIIECWVLNGMTN